MCNGYLLNEEGRTDRTGLSALGLLHLEGLLASELRIYEYIPQKIACLAKPHFNAIIYLPC